MNNKSTEALAQGEPSVFEMEIQSPHVTNKKHKAKVKVIAWDQQKTYALAICAGCFLIWAAVFFPVLVFYENI